MNTEQQKIEYKSLQKIRTGEKGFKELSTTCVALANAQGGQIMIDVEDKTKKPAPIRLYHKKRQIVLLQDCVDFVSMLVLQNVMHAQTKQVE